jgi:uncharacterized protein DUF4255/carboxypeptidase family protein
MTMLALVDEMFKVVLEDGVPSLRVGGAVGASQVIFDPPDVTVAAGVPPVLSLYLIEVRENVKLRSNERHQTASAGGVVSRRAPYRLDCHYLISAFTDSQTGMPPLQHDLLYETTGALVRAQPLVPARVLTGHSQLLDWPPEHRDVELPLTINPPEGFPKLAEFWGTIGQRQPWRPVVYAIVTIPIEYAMSSPAGVVHHAITVYSAGADAQGVGSGPSERRVRVGGAVIDKDRNAVGRARVFARDANGQVLARTTCADDGRFIIDLPAGAVDVYAAAFGFGTTPPLAVPIGPNPTADQREYILNFL